MPKKVSEYLSELESAGIIKNKELLSRDEQELVFDYFAKITQNKLSKKEKLTRLSVVRDEGGQFFAIFNPEKKLGLANGAQGMIKVAQNIKTGIPCLVKIQKHSKKGDKHTEAVTQSRQEKHFAKRNNILYGYQERSVPGKHDFISYLFMKELPGLPIEDGRFPQKGFKALYEKELTEIERLQILRNLLLNFAELTQNRIIHHDLFPRNILIDKADNFAVYFIDWGTAAEMNSEGYTMGYAAHDFQKKKPVRFANGSDFLRLTDTFTELNLLFDNEIRKQIQQLIQASGDLKKNFNVISVNPLIQLVTEKQQKLLSEKGAIKPSLATNVYSST